MKRILVAYTTMAGSTLEVAQAVGEEIAKTGRQVDVLAFDDIHDLAEYAGVVVGGPMILGWHRAALGFIRKHHKSLQHIPLAVFVLSMSLTQTGETTVAGMPIYVDETLPKPPKDKEKLTFRERYARLSNYIQPILNAASPAKPVSIGIFGGRLEYGRLQWWAVLFAMVIIQARAGDRRNWSAIRAWAGDLAEKF
jgi:menaquinone-dependent protoporphyrinogen oxidase